MHLDALRQLLQLVRRSGQEWERPVVRGTTRFTPRSSQATAGFAGSIVKCPPIGSTATSGGVDASDEFHVAEDAGVPCEVDLLAVLELDHDSGSFAEVGPVVGGARMECVRERELDAFDLDGSPLVRAGDAVGLRALSL